MFSLSDVLWKTELLRKAHIGMRWALETHHISHQIHLTNYIYYHFPFLPSYFRKSFINIGATFIATRTAIMAIIITAICCAIVILLIFSQEGAAKLGTQLRILRKETNLRLMRGGTSRALSYPLENLDSTFTQACQTVHLLS